MQLTIQEVDLFFRLHRSLMFFVNERLQIIPDIDTPEQFSELTPEIRLQVRNAILERTELIETFVEENPLGLTDEELEIVGSWKHLVSGRFVVFRYLKNHAVFLSSDQPSIAYGVLALFEPFEDLIGTSLPVYTEAVLLPFRGKIVYDGILNAFNISFGGGLRRSFNESYKEAKERMEGIVTSLPVEPKPAAERKPKKPSQRKSARSATEQVRPYLEAIVSMTDDFCREYLNEDYAQLCRKLAEKLSRKRPSPLLRGQPKTWACAIVRAIGWVNFLHDQTQTPHMRLIDIDHCFGVAESTGAAKLAEIRKMLTMRQFDPEWTLPSRMDDNPLVWTLDVNGFPMDMRYAPREIQEIAFRKGLIPYIPADR
jgi:hypothetical protein